MSKIKFMNWLITIENVLCIYRNYSCLKKYFKRFAVARVALEIFLSIAVCVASILQMIHLNDNPLSAGVYSVYLFLSTINALAPIIIGILRALSFKNLMDNVESVYEYCTEDVTYEKKLNTLRKVVLGLSTLVVSFYSLSFLYKVLRWSEKQDASCVSYILVFEVILMFSVVWREIRFQFEILTINTLIRIIMMSLGQLKIKLVTLSETLDESVDGIDDLTCYQFRMTLEKWITAYNNLTLCRDGINRCFGLQITTSLCLLTFYFMGLCFNWVAILASKEVLGRPDAITIILMILYPISMIVLFYKCQYTQNEGEELKRLMVKLYVKILTIPGANVSELKKLVRDYNRQMALQPIVIQIMSTTNLQMSLLLAILSTSVSYVIVLLQFSHVV